MKENTQNVIGFYIRCRSKVNSKLKINFWSDLRKYITSQLTAFGYQTPSAKELRDQDRAPEERKNATEHYDSQRLITHYFSILMRRLPKANYQVFVSDTIKNDAQKLTLASLIESMFVSGEDVNTHLSHLVKKTDQLKKEHLDLLLSEWGIHHIHFDPDRTNKLLFVHIKGTSVYFIDVLEHEDDEGTIETWTNTGLIEIIHRNWPDAIKAYKVNGDFGCEERTTEQRRNLRDKFTNSFVTVPDGTVYRGPGGGFMANGGAMEVLRATDFIIEQICQHEKDVRAGAEKIRAQLNIADTDSLRLQLKFEPNLASHIYHKNRDRIIRFANP
ncbi:hypothetical protein O59_003948 [Cellvibrio sp. BR]|nr:hypothetical protein O59_003948 [Cellvibrio sp. BR]